MKRATRKKNKYDPMTSFMIVGSAAVLMFLLGGVGSLVDEFCDWGQSPWLGTSSKAAMFIAVLSLLISSIGFAADVESQAG